MLFSYRKKDNYQNLFYLIDLICIWGTYPPFCNYDDGVTVEWIILRICQTYTFTTFTTSTYLFKLRPLTFSINQCLQNQ